MKIIHICLCGTVTDGFLYQDNLLPKYHRKLGLQVSVIASKKIHDNDKYVETNNIDYYTDDDVHIFRLDSIPNIKYKAKIRKYCGLIKILSAEKPDILFIHGIQFLEIPEIIGYLRKHPVSQVYLDNHSDFSNSGRNLFSRNILHKVLWRLNAQLIDPYVTKFYGVLPARVDWLINMYGLKREKCDLLLMGADDDKVQEAYDNDWRTKTRLKNGISDKDFLVMTGGVINLAKKQTLLLMKAVRLLNDPKVKLIVFGSVVPELKEEFFKLVDNKIVLYNGWLVPEETYHYWAACDLAVFPGRHSVFWEQTAGMGIPMVCKYWEGTTHVDTGGNVIFLYDDSVDEIRRVLGDLITNKAKYENMKNCAQKNSYVFSYMNIAKKSIRLSDDPSLS